MDNTKKQETGIPPETTNFWHDWIHWEEKMKKHTEDGSFDYEIEPTVTENLLRQTVPENLLIWV